MDRINELLLEEIARLLQKDVKDPRIGRFVSVTRVETNRDLKRARVYVSIYGAELSQTEVLEGLASAASYIRRQLFRNLSLKTVPQLSFVLDDSIARGVRIASILQELERESQQDDENEEEDRPEPDHD
jgi:ribosome-binding factor A